MLSLLNGSTSRSQVNAQLFSTTALLTIGVAATVLLAQQPALAQDDPAVSEPAATQTDTGATEVPPVSEPPPADPAAVDADAATGIDTMPELVVEQDPDAQGESETVTETASEPRPRPTAPPRATVQTVSDPASANDPIAGFASEDAVQEAIFDLPVDGSTLQRGTFGIEGYYAGGTSTATKTATEIMNIPGSVSIITEELARDQGATLLGEALLYVPGITVQQGEGHRDQISFRGQSTTADFFLDGVRDDIETFRDLYNIQAVEVLKGPNAMIFGRGGGGGVINRVTKRADGVPIYEGTLQLGSYGRVRGTADVGQAISSNAAVRLNAFYEDGQTFRDFSYLDSYGINPTMGFRLDDRTTLHFYYEYRSLDQNVDRGGPSISGRPFQYPIETFFGQPFVSLTTFEGHIGMATLEHETLGGVQIRNHSFYADYDKLYQNVFAATPVNGPGTGLGFVGLNGYQSDQDRQNFFNQTDVGYSFSHGEHFHHTLVTGVEVGVQDNFEFRNLPTFDSPDSGIFAFSVPPADPTSGRATFFNRPQRRNDTSLTTFSAFIQDQFEITRYFELIAGIRFDRFDVDFSDSLRDFTTARVDEEWSPRVGGVIKPWENFHVYLSYAQSFLPANGDNFGALPVTREDIGPEEFTNYEAGFKWELRPNLLMQGAIYRLDRDNQPVIIGPDTFARGLTRSTGQEIEISGYLTDKWQVFGGYSHIDTEIISAGDNVALVGNSVPSVPTDTFSMWNRYQFAEKWGCGPWYPSPIIMVRRRRQFGLCPRLLPVRRRGLLRYERKLVRAGEHRKPVRCGVLHKLAQQQQYFLRRTGVGLCDAGWPLVARKRSFSTSSARRTPHSRAVFYVAQIAGRSRVRRHATTHAFGACIRFRTFHYLHVRA